MAAEPVRIGTAGWAIPRAVRERFGEAGSGLQRYATRLNCAEINSTFYRMHKAETFARWADETPESFRFAVKAPKSVTHERRLRDAGALMADFVSATAALGEKRGPILVQLPGSLRFETDVAEAFFTACRETTEGPLVCEPRHASWFEAEADALLRRHRIARAAADPAVTTAAASPGGWPGLRYWRLHGSPRLYATPYAGAQLDALADDLRSETTPAWCIFDNTMSGAAAENALDLQLRLTPHRPPSPL